MTVTKRFIAGAVCPKCGEMDRLVLYKEGDTQYRECVSCGFKDELRLSFAGRELPTRVNQTEKEKAAEVSQVKIIDP
jgi:uncharacterized protein